MKGIVALKQICLGKRRRNRIIYGKLGFLTLAIGDFSVRVTTRIDDVNLSDHEL